MSAPQTAATANGEPRTPISFQRLTTPPSPKLPPVGVLLHAYHCQTPNCKIGSCAQTKRLISRIARHVQTCAHKRTLTPGRAHPTKNTCKFCRLNEALNASSGQTKTKSTPLVFRIFSEKEMYSLIAPVILSRVGDFNLS